MAEADQAMTLEQRLAWTEANLDALIQGTRDFILVFDAAGEPVLFNRAYAEVIKAALGIEMKPGLKPHTLLEDADDRAWWESHHARALAGEAFRVEYSGEVAGQPIDLELAYTPILGPDDAVLGFTEVSREITERKNAERSLAERERRYREVSELTSDFAYAFGCDEQGKLRIEWITDAITRITGYTVAELQGKGGWPEMIHPEDRHVAQGQLEQLLAGNAATVEYRVLTKARAVRWVRDVARPEQVDGRTVRIVGAVQDLTQVRAAELERRQIEERMQRAQKLESLGLLSGGVAHDFNNLLMAIQGNAELAESTLPEDAPELRFLERIQEASARAATLCAQMLAYAGKGLRVQGPVDLSQIVRDMGRMLEVSVSKKISLRTAVAARLPAIEADPSQLSQVVMNLITNASEAIGDNRGKIELTTGLDDCRAGDLVNPYIPESRPAGRYVFLRVRDTGCGMDAETQALMFDPFFSSKFTGRGLGLAAVLGIVRSHEGAILVESTPGKGTTVRVYFPALAQAEVFPTPVVVDPEPTWRGSGLVLLVDDDRLVRRVAEHQLERMGFTVVSAVDGRQAVELFAERAAEFAAVVLDVAMPVVDGTQCCRELRELRGDVPIIVASGYAEEEVMRRFDGLELAGTLQKPYKPAALRRLMRGALGAGR